MTTPGDLPPLNPFPVQATTSVEEGSFLQSYRPWARTTPTLTVEPVLRLTALARRFRSSRPARGRPDGQAAFVYGPHGAGKTHAIRAAIGLAATEAEGDGPALLPLYVKLSSPNVVNAYRRLMSQLSIAELTELALRFLGSLTSAAGPSPTGSVQERLRQDPTALLTMFSEHVLERGLLLQAQADRLRAVVTGEQDFQRALTYLLEPDLKDAAYNWLQGRAIGEPDMRRLGLSGVLDTPDQCRYGLQLLTLICARAARPLVLILDQAEKFLAQPDGTVVADSMGFLHSLVEAVPDLGGMLVVAANDETWQMLPTDLRQRFGANDIACAAVQPGQAFELLGLYIMAAYREPPAGYRAPQPFTEPAVHKLLRNSGGNLRSLLQLAWQSFDRLAPGQHEIDTGHVPDEEVRYDRNVVEAAVRRALWGLGSPARNPRPGFQYALSLGGTGRLLIRVSEAMFYLDEADRADEDIRVSEAAGEALLDRHVLIVIGYASREVLHVLGQVYDDVLVYRDDDTLADQLAALVDPGQQRSGVAAADYEQARERLAELGWSRAEAGNNLGQGVAAVGRHDETERAARRYEELSTRWPAERDRLAGSIAAARDRRDEEDLDELHRVATGYQRRRWLRLATAAAAVPLTFLTIVAVFQAAGGDTRSYLAVAGIAVVVVAFIAAATAIGLRLQPPRATSLSEADRMARDTAATADDLRSPDPYRRYGALLLGLRGETPLRLRQALRVERVRLIRRVFAAGLGTLLSGSHHGSLSEALAEADPADLPYLLEKCRAPRWSDVARLPAPTRALVAIVHGYGTGDPAGAQPSGPPASGPAIGTVGRRAADAPAEETDPAVRLVVAAAAGDGALGEAYRKGLTFDRLVRALGEADDRDLRRAVTLLSPAEGLAAHHLAAADEVERLYLFVEQLVYFRDGGINLAPPA